MNIPICETLREAAYDDGSKLLSGIILEAGLSRNGNFYTPESLANAADKFAGVKCFIDHPRDGNIGQRSIRDVCGVVEECRYESGRLRARIRISESHDWIAAMVNEGILGDVSINALGHTKLTRRDGRVVREVTEISKAYSVDFVTEAAAGGRVAALLRESAGFSEGLRLIENITLSELTESRPDLVERLKIGDGGKSGDADTNGGGGFNGATDEEVSEVAETEADAQVNGETIEEADASVASLDLEPLIEDVNPKHLDEKVNLEPLIEGVLAERNIPVYIATYLRNHLRHTPFDINANADTPATPDPLASTSATEDAIRNMISDVVEDHLDYLGGLAGAGMIRSISQLDQLHDRTSTARKSTFNFLGLPNSRKASKSQGMANTRRNGNTQGNGNFKSRIS